MLKSLTCVAVVIVSVNVVAAQTVRAPVAPAAAAADMQKLQATMMAAQAAAVKPGDEALPCEALQKELISTMNDPAIQAYAAKTNAAYAKEQAAREKKNPGMTPESAAALAASLYSGMPMAGLPPTAGIPGQQMTPQQMQQAMLAQQQAAMTYMNQLAPIMPALMRSQRVSMLAMMKNCTWATAGLGLYPGLAPTR